MSSGRVDFSQNASTYDRRHGAVIADDVARQLARAASLRQGSRVLDLAAGTGRVAIPLTALGCRVVALDPARPMLAAPGADEAVVVLAAIREALVGGPKQVSLVVPGRAERILAMLARLGFRIEESMLMMAARSFGDLARYLPNSPGLM